MKTIIKGLVTSLALTCSVSAVASKNSLEVPAFLNTPISQAIKSSLFTGIPNIKYTAGIPNIKYTAGIPNIKYTAGIPNIKYTAGIPNIKYTAGIPNIK
ncbi:hypothetical protein ACVBIL_20040, partial [Shewanella sp. 125m-7]